MPKVTVSTTPVAIYGGIGIDRTVLVTNLSDSVDVYLGADAALDAFSGHRLGPLSSIPWTPGVLGSGGLFVVCPTGGPVQVGYVDNDENMSDPGAIAGQIAIRGVAPAVTTSFFGGGSDGDVTMSPGVTFISSAKYYRNLTFQSGAVLDAPYPVYVSGVLDMRLPSMMRSNGFGSAATDRWGFGSGIAGQGGGVAGSPFPIGGFGGNPPNGNATAGGNGGTLASVTGGAGRNAGTPGTGFGAAAGASINAAPSLDATLVTKSLGSGGGGGADAANIAGGGGGVLVVIARSILLPPAMAAYPQFSACGGDGSMTGGTQGAGGGGTVVFVTGDDQDISKLFVSAAGGRNNFLGGGFNGSPIVITVKVAT